MVDQFGCAISSEYTFALIADFLLQKINQPAYVKEVAEKISDIKNISIEEVDRITTKNAESLFKKLAN